MTDFACRGWASGGWRPSNGKQLWTAQPIATFQPWALQPPQPSMPRLLIYNCPAVGRPAGIGSSSSMESSRRQCSPLPVAAFQLRGAQPPQPACLRQRVYVGLLDVLDSTARCPRPPSGFGPPTSPARLPAALGPAVPHPAPRSPTPTSAMAGVMPALAHPPTVAIPPNGRLR